MSLPAFEAKCTLCIRIECGRIAVVADGDYLHNFACIQIHDCIVRLPIAREAHAQLGCDRRSISFRGVGDFADHLKVVAKVPNEPGAKTGILVQTKK